ncbi:hypothetical protein B6D60_11610 [candidate division KSB1 bacterium 4484_87]|nr:MAG: hypothetical protein B6D60_11610 [candidate division KSB1 bacterium 4484_87]
MTSHVIEKALEVWLLQNLLNFTIIFGLLALGLALVQQYYSSLQKHLTLRVSIELWNVLTIVLVDILLAIIVIIGYMVLNPDIMADIKMAIPFIPVAIILFTIALVLRLFYGGHKQGNANFVRSIWLMFWANILNIIGFTFVMEAPSGEYLAHHPSAFWTFIKTHLRSNADPHGLELAQITFYICFPIFIIVLIWGFVSALRQLKNSGDE